MEKKDFTKTISTRLNRALGQVRGVGQMIDNEKYCIDVIRQIRAAKATLGALEKVLLDRHLNTCVRSAFQDGKNSDKKIQEILSLFSEIQK